MPNSLQIQKEVGSFHFVVSEKDPGSTKKVGTLQGIDIQEDNWSLLMKIFEGLKTTWQTKVRLYIPLLRQNYVIILHFFLKIILRFSQPLLSLRFSGKEKRIERYTLHKNRKSKARITKNSKSMMSFWYSKGITNL